MTSRAGRWMRHREDAAPRRRARASSDRRRTAATDQRLAADQEPEPDAEERAEQHEVREVADRCTMLAPSQRISASSRNSISALPSSSRSTVRRSAPLVRGASSAPRWCSSTVVTHASRQTTAPCPGALSRQCHRSCPSREGQFGAVIRLGYAPLCLARRSSPDDSSRAIGLWRSLVARLVRDEEVAGSNPVSPTSVMSQDIGTARTYDS